MTASLKKLARAVVPRPVRNWLRSPGQALRWLRNEWQPPVEFRVQSDWTLRCPRNAAERAFAPQFDDPPQVEEFALFLGHVRTTGRVVLLDVGSHFGLFSYAAIRYGSPGSTALAVDPSMEAESMVNRIVRLQGWQDRIQFLRAAAGSKDDSIELVDTGVTGAGYMVLPRDHPARDRQSLAMLSLDSLARRMGEPPNLVKIDVEGFELEVLRGGSVTLGQRRPPLFLEIHNQIIRQCGGDPEAVVAELIQLGYDSFQVGPHPVAPATLTRSEIVRVLARHRSVP